MKPSVTLTVTALLSILLLTIHVTDDMVHGWDRVGLQNIFGVVIMVVWLYGALVLIERRSGLIIVLVGGIFAAGVAVVHWRGAVVSSREFAMSPGAFRFIWTLWALSVTGAFSIILAARGLRRLQVEKRDRSTGGA